MKEDRLLKFFDYSHLPENLKDYSARFYELAEWIAEVIPAGPERTVGLRKLLEAKDCIVRTLARPDIPEDSHAS